MKNDSASSVDVINMATLCGSADGKTAPAQAAFSAVPKEPVTETFTGKEDNWLKADVIAAIAATVTAGITIGGSDNVSGSALLGAAAGVGASYLATKWITECFGMQDNGLGKALGLVIGIDLGYGLTQVGINASKKTSEMNNWM